MLNAYDTARIMRACEAARRQHPGPVGELLEQELRAWDEFAQRFVGGGHGDLMHRLVDHLSHSRSRELKPEP